MSNLSLFLSFVWEVWAWVACYTYNIVIKNDFFQQYVYVNWWLLPVLHTCSPRCWKRCSKGGDRQLHPEDPRWSTLVALWQHCKDREHLLLSLQVSHIHTWQRKLRVTSVQTHTDITCTDSMMCSILCCATALLWYLQAVLEDCLTGECSNSILCLTQVATLHDVTDWFVKGRIWSREFGLQDDMLLPVNWFHR